MKINDFKVEQWMTKYEGEAKYNLTDTCAKSLTVAQLLEMETIDFNRVVLDYGQITGDERLKDEILKLYESGKRDMVTLCQGCSQANDIVIDTLLEKGDHIITFVPGYQQFYELPKQLGCTVTCIETYEKDQWIPSIQKVIDAVQDNTKMIIFNNPNNPTGALIEEEYFNQLIPLCKEKGIYILCDEVYKSWKYSRSISDLYDLGISTCSLSKQFALAGLRIGWIKANVDVINQINIRRDYAIISTGPLVDELAYVALKHKEEIINRTERFVSQNKKIITEWLKEHPRFHVVLPKEGTVCFLGCDYSINSSDFALKLLEEMGVFFVPGSCFDVEGYFRLGLAQDPENMEKGLSALSDYLVKIEI